MPAALQKAGAFVVDALCDLKPDGTAGKASFARISLALLLAFVLGWVTALTIWHRALPDMSGVIGFVSAWGGLVYMPSKFVSAWQNRGINGMGERGEERR
jgi:hypothetical protein